MASRVRKQDLYNVASTDDRSGKKIKTAHKGGDAALHAAFVSLLKTPLASLLFLALPSTLRLKQKKLRAKEKGGQTAPPALVGQLSSLPLLTCSVLIFLPTETVVAYRAVCRHTQGLEGLDTVIEIRKVQMFQTRPHFGWLNCALILPPHPTSSVANTSALLAAQKAPDATGKYGGRRQCRKCLSNRQRVLTYFFHLLHQYPLCSACCTNENAALIALKPATLRFCIPATILTGGLLSVLVNDLAAHGTSQKPRRVFSLAAAARAAGKYWTAKARKKTGKGSSSSSSSGASSSSSSSSSSSGSDEVRGQQMMLAEILKRNTQARLKHDSEQLKYSQRSKDSNMRKPQLRLYGQKLPSQVPPLTPLVDFDPAKRLALVLPTEAEKRRPLPSEWMGYGKVKRVEPVAKRTRTSTAEAPAAVNDDAGDAEVVYLGSKVVSLTTSSKERNKTRATRQAIKRKNERNVVKEGQKLE